LSRFARGLVAATVAILALAAVAAPVMAVDEPVLTGTALDPDGRPFEVERALLTMTGPGGAGIHAVPFEVDADGTFAVPILPWGTPDAPAAVEISITGAVTEAEPEAAGCANQYAPVVESTFPIALEGGGQPEPLALVADLGLVGTVCGEAVASAPTLPPSEVDPAPAAPTSGATASLDPAVDDGAGMPWLVVGTVAIAAVALALLVGAARLLGGRPRG